MSIRPQRKFVIDKGRWRVALLGFGYPHRFGTHRSGRSTRAFSLGRLGVLTIMHRSASGEER